MDFRTVNELIVSHICAWPQIATFVHLAASCGLFIRFSLLALPGAYSER